MEDKLSFIIDTFPQLLKTLNADTIGKWGKMNAQQMVEHVADFFKVSNGKLIFALLTPVDLLPKYKEFLLSEKEFKENTKAPAEVVSEEPIPVRNESFQKACAELNTEIIAFAAYFKTPNVSKTIHPVFGPLHFDEWIKLHYKHCLHHAKQFNLL
ncbi:MAG: hypothetical protein IPP48_09880 [Chitinophagaceae bacterium]|nr:hypothetical protein [Chitinophagaceae bacterium]